MTIIYSLLLLINVLFSYLLFLNTILNKRQITVNIIPINARTSNTAIKPSLKVCVILFGVPSGGVPSENRAHALNDTHSALSNDTYQGTQPC